MRRSLATVFVIAASLAACSKKAKVDTGPACPKVVDNMLVVMKQAYKGHDTVELANRDQMIAQCEQRKMSAKERTCLAEAKTVNDLASCRSAKPGAGTPTPTRPLPIGGAAPGAGIAPTGSAAAAPVPPPADSAQ